MNLPNPFQFADATSIAPVDKAVAFDTPVLDAAADRFVLDEAAFVRAIEPPICADELVDVLAVLAGY